jgi:tetratricopeptide (TPR) repeat protein
MKAEHRKELQTNILADRMGRLLHGAKSAPKSTSTLIWIFIILGLGTIVAWRYYAYAVRSDRSALWVSFDATTHEDPITELHDLTNLAENNRGSLAGRTASFQMARLYLRSGQSGLTSPDRKAAIERIDEARTIYSELVDKCADTPLLAQEASLGLASAEESLAGVHVPEDETTKEISGSLEKAMEYYDKLAAKYPDSVAGRAADKRAKELREKQNFTETASFYAQLNDLAIPRQLPEGKQSLEKKETPKTTLPPILPLPEEPVKVPPAKTEPTAKEKTPAKAATEKQKTKTPGLPAPEPKSKEKAKGTDKK